MGFSLKLRYCCLVSVMMLLPALCYSDNFDKSRATYYSRPDGLGTPSGACGFGEYGRNISDGNVAGVYKLYNNGIGCGACYQQVAGYFRLSTNDTRYLFNEITVRLGAQQALKSVLIKG
ncbi:expansin-like B1 [Gossypium australe]|uniref:Expansin-like B1 n=1 Tax=Gossypium australe TaxID=47621 RepID=A0A5B6VJB5_9ROSI|nr:expansin-like B1 [Gossypium australe]